MRNVVYLELIICRRPILFEHNCTIRSHTSPALLAMRFKIFIIKCLTLADIELETDMLPYEPAFVQLKG